MVNLEPSKQWSTEDELGGLGGTHMHANSVLISAPTRETHDSTLWEVLQCLLVGGDRIQPCECTTGLQGMLSLDHNLPLPSTCSMQASHTFSRATQLHSRTALLHSCAALATDACHVCYSHKVVDAAKPFGKFVHSNMPKLCSEKRYTVHMGTALLA